MSIARILQSEALSSERRLSLSDRQATILSLLVLTLVSFVAIWRILGNGTLIGQDSATQFYPWYDYLGQRLRDFEIPAWNPSQFSGAPFAADPQSGWTYVPAMVAFSLFSLSTAISVYLVFHLLLAGFGAFALARAIGIGRLGALTTGIAYELSGPVFSRSICCPAQLQVISWVPVVLLGIEMTMRRENWESRLRWMALTAFGLSQVVASWIGQGSYYVALLAGAYVVYRGVIDPPRSRSALWPNIAVAGVVGFGTAAMGAGLSAAGIMPRLKFNELSNVAGGRYQNDHVTAAVSGGWQAGDTFFKEVTTDPYYMGSIVIALAVIAVFLARGRLATPFFSFVLLVSFVLSASLQTPLHTIFYTLFPRFEELHRHWPERIAMSGFIAIALLTGAAVDSLPGWLGSRRKILPIVALPGVTIAIFAVHLWRSNDAIPFVVYAGVALTVVAAVVVAYGSRPRQADWATAALVAMVAVELSVANAGMVRTGPYGGYFDVDLDTYLAPSNAAQFLIGQQKQETFRFFGFDPRLQQMSAGWPVYYRYQFGNERTRSIIVNNRATLHGLQDVQGYNPVQLQSYVEYMTLLNGAPQDYHDENVMPPGLTSPLLDLLNARYIVVPSDATIEGDPLLLELARTYETVFDDGLTRVLARPDPLPRAWIVHDAIFATGMDGAAMVANGQIDPRTTATIDVPLPRLQADGSLTENVIIQMYEPERIQLRTESASDGILLLSEVDYPSWKATIDGVPVEVTTAFGLIRSLSLPAGTHVVEFQYDASSEILGLELTAITMLAMTGLAVGLKLAPRKSRNRDTSGHESLANVG